MTFFYKRIDLLKQYLSILKNPKILENLTLEKTDCIQKGVKHLLNSKEDF